MPPPRSSVRPASPPTATSSRGRSRPSTASSPAATPPSSPPAHRCARGLACACTSERGSAAFPGRRGRARMRPPMQLRRAHWLVLLAITLALPPSSADAQGPFPLRASENGRFLIDAGGRPFPILGRTAWFMALLSAADAAVFLDDTQGRGFNAVELSLIGRDPRGRHVPFDDRGAAPFLRRIDGRPWTGGLTYADAATESPDFTTPNEAYWRGIDTLISDLEARGLLAFVF